MAGTIGTPTAVGDTGGPGATPLKIGPVVFRTEECPDKLPLGGGKQKHVITELVGGGIVDQHFGTVPVNPVQWSGTFFGAFVEQRVQLLRQMMVSGAEYVVSYQREQYYCRVSDFQPYYRGNRCDYDIKLTITRDSNGAFSVANTASLDSQVSALMGDVNSQIAALVAADPTGTATAQADITSMQVAIKNAGPIAQSSGASFTSLVNSITTAIASATAYYNTLTETAATYLNASRLVSALTLISSNVQRGQSTKSIRKQGGNLFEVASMYYGDASLAYDLADANGLASPFLSNNLQQDIILPPFPSRST